MSTRRVARSRARMAWFVTSALTAVLLSGCGSPRRSEPIAGSLELSDLSVQRGRLAYDRHCHSCHGSGEGGMAPSLNEKLLPKALMRLQIRIGLGAMPAFPESELSDEEVADIAEYLARLRKHGE